LGTVRDLVQYNTTTSTTTLVNHIQYDTFGQLTSQTDPTKTPWFGYTGREWDTATGLTYYRARWYDPRAGRFISEDPLSFAAGDVNLNRYVGNGATLWVDPSGMAGQAYTTSYQQMMAEMQSFAIRCSGGGVIDTNGPDGYSNPFTRWIGENLVRGVIEDARLIKPGGVGDDILLTTIFVTHYTQRIDPTPASGVINAGSRVIDGDREAIPDLLVNSITLGGGLRKAARLGQTAHKAPSVLGGFPINTRLGANSFGSPGKPDHQRAVKKLLQTLMQMFPDTDTDRFEFTQGRSIKKYDNGVNRNPDVAVIDVNREQVVCVGEAARENRGGSLVKRERVKLVDYIQAGIQVIHQRIPHKNNTRNRRR
jgi:RHS repeat-associated protein